MAGRAPSGRCAWSHCWREPPGLRRPKAGHPATRRPKPRAAPSTLRIRGTRGLRPTVRDGSAAPGRVPQVAHGRAPRRRGSDLPGGAGAFRRPTTPANSRVGPDVAGTGHPAGGGPSAGVPRPNLSLSLSLFPLPSHLPLSLALSQLPGRWCRWPLERHHGVGMARRIVTPGVGGGAELATSPPYSLRQSLAHPSATGAAVRPGPACWRCRDPGHFQDHCPMMEVGLLVRVPDSPGAGPDQAGQYQIPVSIKGGTYQALVDSGCNQTSIHQSLIQQRALDTGRKVKVRCVHGDVADYPLVPVLIKFQGKMHRMEVAVNSHLKHPLIFGTDWPGFHSIVGDSMCGCLLADGAGPGGGSGLDRRGASGPVPACLGGNESQRGGETPGAGWLSSGAVAGWGAQKRVRPGPLHWRAASPAGRPPLLPLFFPYKREVVSGNARCPVKGDDNPVISPQEPSGNDFSGTWGRQRHANASWPDSFGRAFTRTSAGGVRRVGNASW